MSQVQLLSDLDLVKKIKAMVISAPKAGKTTLAGTFPGDIGFIDTDYGVKVLKNPYFLKNYPDQIPKIRFIQVEDPTGRKGVFTKAEAIWKVEEQLNTWNEDPTIQTVVVDSMTSFADLAIHAGLIAAKDADRSKTYDRFVKSGVLLRTQADFGAEMGIIEQVIDWLIKMDKNVLVMCHERPQLSESGGVMYIEPLLTGKLRARSARWFDEVWYLKVEGKAPDTKRILITQADGMLKTVGSRLGLPARIENPDYNKLIKLVQEAQVAAAPKAVKS